MPTGELIEYALDAPSAYSNSGRTIDRHDLRNRAKADFPGVVIALVHAASTPERSEEVKELIVWLIDEPKKKDELRGITVDALKKLLAKPIDENPTVAALTVLKAFGESAHPASEEVSKACSAPQERVRLNAIETGFAIAVSREEEIPLLAVSLSDGSESIRSSAIRRAELFAESRSDIGSDELPHRSSHVAQLRERQIATSLLPAFLRGLDFKPTQLTTALLIYRLGLFDAAEVQNIMNGANLEEQEKSVALLHAAAQYHARFSLSKAVDANGGSKLDESVRREFSRYDGVMKSTYATALPKQKRLLMLPRVLFGLERKEAEQVAWTALSSADPEDRLAAGEACKYCDSPSQTIERTLDAIETESNPEVLAKLTELLAARLNHLSGKYSARIANHVIRNQSFRSEFCRTELLAWLLNSSYSPTAIDAAALAIEELQSFDFNENVQDLAAADAAFDQLRKKLDTDIVESQSDVTKLVTEQTNKTKDLPESQLILMYSTDPEFRRLDDRIEFARTRTAELKEKLRTAQRAIPEQTLSRERFYRSYGDFIYTGLELSDGSSAFDQSKWNYVQKSALERSNLIGFWKADYAAFRNAALVARNFKPDPMTPYRIFDVLEALRLSSVPRTAPEIAAGLRYLEVDQNCALIVEYVDGTRDRFMLGPKVVARIKEAPTHTVSYETLSEPNDIWLRNEVKKILIEQHGTTRKRWNISAGNDATYEEVIDLPDALKRYLDGRSILTMFEMTPDPREVEIPHAK